MPRGRKPTPLKILELTDSSARRKRRHKRSEPKPPEGEPVCPTCLDAAGKRAWKVLVGTLKDLGLLATSDGMLMAILCQEWALFCWAAKEVNRLKRARAIVDMRKVQVIAKDALQSCFRAAQEFGLGPSARTRIHIPNKGKDESKFAAFLTKRRA